MCERYDRGAAMILTSNVSYGEWDRLIGDPVLAGAMLDRLPHRSITINIRGPSYRLKDRLKTGVTSQRLFSNSSERGGEF